MEFRWPRLLRPFRSLATGAVALGLGAAVLFAAPGDPVVLAGTTWSTQGTARASVPGGRAVEVPTFMGVEFLNETDFRVTNPEFSQFTGTYVTRGKRRNRAVGSFSTDSLEAMAEALRSSLEDAGGDAWAAEARGASFRATVDRDGVLKVRMKLKILLRNLELRRTFRIRESFRTASEG